MATTFNNTCLILALICTPSPTLASHGLRALGKSVESCTRPVSSQATLAKCTRRECTAGIRLHKTGAFESRDGCVPIAFAMLLFVAYHSKCDCTHWSVHQTRRSHTCRNLQAFWRASVNGHRCQQECKVKRLSI